MVSRQPSEYFFQTRSKAHRTKYQREYDLGMQPAIQEKT